MSFGSNRGPHSSKSPNPGSNPRLEFSSADLGSLQFEDLDPKRVVLLQDELGLSPQEPADYEIIEFKAALERRLPACLMHSLRDVELAGVDDEGKRTWLIEFRDRRGWIIPDPAIFAPNEREYRQGSTETGTKRVKIATLATAGQAGATLYDTISLQVRCAVRERAPGNDDAGFDLLVQPGSESAMQEILLQIERFGSLRAEERGSQGFSIGRELLRQGVSNAIRHHLKRELDGEPEYAGIKRVYDGTRRGDVFVVQIVVPPYAESHRELQQVVELHNLAAGLSPANILTLGDAAFFERGSAARFFDRPESLTGSG